MPAALPIPFCTRFATLPTRAVTLELEKVYRTELSPLHYDIVDFARRVTPTEAEVEHWQNVISIVEDAAAEVLGPHARVEAFGSFPATLSLHCSDLDLVILNFIRVQSSGYTLRMRAKAVKSLYNVGKRIVQSRALPLSYLQVIPTARVPILKMTTKDGVMVDLSIYSRQGVRAASHIRNLLPKYPAARPLILVIKSLLREVGLNDVADGGLGGYALANMVLVHCQEMETQNEVEQDFGYILLKFFDRFGIHFDFTRFAVSVRRAGVISKKVIERETKDWIRYNAGWDGRTDGKQILYVEDPLIGVNVSKGTSRYPEIRKYFREAHRVLRYSKPQRGNMLDLLFDVDRALERNTLRVNNRVEMRGARCRAAGQCVQRIGRPIRSNVACRSIARFM